MAIRLSEQQVLEATGAVRRRIGAVASYGAVCTDSRAIAKGSLFVALKGDRFDAHDFLDAAAQAGAAGVVVQAGRALTLTDPHVAVYEVRDTLAALGDLARFHRLRFKKPVGAVTGSNGKTTTKELIAAILETRGPALKTHGNLNNEVGVPLTLFGLEPRHVAAIVEMGMNHLGEIARLTDIARPDAGLITIVQPAHLEGVGSIDGVAQAKAELFVGLGAGATAVVNLDDERIAARAQGLRAKRLTYGRAPEADVRLARVEPHGRTGLSLVVHHDGKDWPVALRLIGDHNALNATAAFSMGVALGYSPDECVRGLEAAQAHTRRLQLLHGLHGETVVDDCYNANPASMTAALATLAQVTQGGRAVAVLGDMLELGPDEARAHAQMGTTASDVAQVVGFFGERMALAHAQAVKRLGPDNAKHFTDIEALKAWLLGTVRRNDAVLVKGSRGMRLERVVEALTGQAAKGH